MAATNGERMTVQERIALINHNLQEVLNPEIIEDVMVKQNRNLEVYWGSATTGRPHCGYIVPTIKIASLLRAGCSVKVLLADIHGFLDNLKAPLELVQHRAQYYRYVITALMKSCNVDVSKLQFVLGSSYQLTPQYTMDLFKLSSVVTEHDAKKAGSEVVKQVDNATLSGLIYPLMQALDEEYLKVDAQFGGVDQRKIFALAKDVLPRIGYKERAHLMNPMVPGLQGGKMSASDPDSKIDLLDEPEVVRRKLKKAVCEPRKVEENGVLSFVEYVILPTSEMRQGAPRFEVPRREGEPLVYSNIEKMHEDYRSDVLTPQLLKPAVTDYLISLLQPILADFKASKEWQAVEKLAYPPAEPAKKKKDKAKKDKGSRYPGGAAKAAGVEAKPDGHVEGDGAEAVALGVEKVKVADS